MKSPEVDAYIARAAPFARPVLKKLRALVHEACPGVEEAMKWGMPFFLYKGPLCNMAAFKQHASFGFWKAKLLGLRNGGAMGDFGRLRGLDDLPSDAAFKALVRKAAALNEAGVKAPRARPAAEVPVPAELQAALSRNTKAQVAFKAFTPAKRRDYSQWISEAKAEDTRRRRIETAIAWIAEGKSRNWKYER